ncbi:5-methyltetrahydrofolate--homocysteine methyltransferase [Anaerovirgula multivorans]|uniref:5-methyltetrahydrofolate--homocysteine methyltransferase n=1 Tax=Anaerovirgula multivorans TaxID=312168 RepID=A0A239C110_9FIRM|nr:corrinoid protein [Anaerovirgula multivorans]SNS13341.1 5-methyltetrahydrofolate--homocysteine methyltransferase [Anaerovirgula multivorans]
MSLYDQIAEVLQKGQVAEVQRLVKEALDQGLKSEGILNEGLLKGMMDIGDRWKRNEAFVPEVLIAARAMNGGMEVLEKALADEDVKPKGTVVMGTVKGDLHDIGKNLVVMMMKGAGYKVIDLGVDIPAEKFVEAAEAHQADVVCMSALLTTTMPYIKTVVDEFENKGVREKYAIMAGGAPVTEEYVKEVGGDFYTKDAVSAADKLAEIIN